MKLKTDKDVGLSKNFHLSSEFFSYQLYTSENYNFIMILLPKKLMTPTVRDNNKFLNKDVNCVLKKRKQNKRNCLRNKYLYKRDDDFI